MTISADLRSLATAELYTWLHLAQEGLAEARSIDDEVDSETLCDALVSELVSRAS